MAGWAAALEYFSDLAATTSADWMLVGRAASAVHGVGLQLGDVDLLATGVNSDVCWLRSLTAPCRARAGVVANMDVTGRRRWAYLLTVGRG